jgi:glycerol kinase
VAQPAILAIDQGTTNSKAVLVNADGGVLGANAAPVSVAHPRPGWVEQDADQIWSSVLAAVVGCLAGTPDAWVVAVALSTQRESVVGWSRSTGRSVSPVLGWQDARTAERWAGLIADAPPMVRRRTGLRVDAMFSAPKINWLLTHLSGQPLVDVCVGTVDSWLVWRLTGGGRRACDAGNASRTLLYDIRQLAWSTELCELFEVPLQVLPEVLASNGNFGDASGAPGIPDGTPIAAVMADSHAALLGQGCTTPGSAKATYGTGTSVMMPDSELVERDSAVPTTLAWLTDRPTYAREGNILSSGSTLAWTAELLGLNGVGDLMALARGVPDSGGVSLVPAFSGLGAPHWNRELRASLSGMTGGTTRAHVARAALDAVAHQVCDIVDVIEAEGSPLIVLRADGGATAGDLLMQTQADLLGVPVEVAAAAEVSALGAAQLAWQALGVETDWAERREPARTFRPDISDAERQERRQAWHGAVATAPK